MNVKDLYPCQFEELREKIIFCTSLEDLDAVGADYSKWTYDEWETFYEGLPIPDELVVKSFDSYIFGCDDFFCTAGNYDEYPDREE